VLAEGTQQLLPAMVLVAQWTHRVRESLNHMSLHFNIFQLQDPQAGNDSENNN
jgi:hypothetical protein